MSSSGVHWRLAVTAAENMVDEGGNLSLHDWEAAFTYTTGTGAEIAGRSVTGATTPAEIADVIVESLPSAIGDAADQAYVQWYARLLDLVHHYHALPVAYADCSNPADGWEVGWGGNVYVSTPPPIPSAGCTH
ncbi:hypothetical protein CSW57_21200 [Williamsia muralis]|uniref:Uncharacterized protein n=1 Tax=Williamsia marianensis TaxID=85044 RepID=A0A2G3PJZ0_WILMA|nr:hypothetical protein CSW57_21200 [Williamsia marianensis]